MTTTTSPYADAFDAYWRAGWRGILPLPHGTKTPPPEGFTGYDGAFPSYADCAAWADDGARNIALRFDPTTIGLDVDAYDGKPGGETLMRLVEEHGPLPPTYLSTSRADGMSGIRPYRVPPGIAFPTKLPGIELIQHFHRYAVAWPSRHPNGGQYRWIDERTGQELDGPPALEDIPYLPEAWVRGLADEGKKQAEKADLGTEQAAAILAAMRKGEPCRHVLAAAGKALSGGDRHDTYNEAILAILGYGRRGCPGAQIVIERLKASFIAEISNRSTQGEAAAEFRRGLLGALAIVANEIPGTTCPDEVEDYVRSLEHTAPVAQADGEGQADDLPPQMDPLDQAVGRRLAELVVNERAKERLATMRAAGAPPLPRLTLADFLAQPDEEERYRVGDLWPAEGRVLLAAAAKSGKTTLVTANLIPSLVDGRPFLGRFDATPVDGTVVLLNMEVGPRTLRNWMAQAQVENTDRVIVANLRGAASALQLASEQGRARTAEFLRSVGAEVVILDPLAPVLATLGLDENSNADVAQFFSWWSEALAMAGVVDDLVVHHTGHAGERSRGASRLLDEPDAIWTLVKGKDTPSTEDNVYGNIAPRYLGAYGRDVELAARRLDFTQASKALVLTDELQGSSRVVTNGDRIVEALRAYGEGMTVSQMVEKGYVKGNKDTVAKSCKSLVDAGRIQVSERALRGGHWVDIYVLSAGV